MKKKAPEQPPDFVSLVRGNYKVEWENLNEGLHGDYNPKDPKDVNLLRFYVLYNHMGDWVEMNDGSYCTQVPVGTSAAIQVRLAGIIMDAVCAHREGESVKKVCEQLSWMDPSWTEKDAKHARSR